MTAISEQAKELRELAKALSNTADIIEFLSAKLTAEHMERQAVYDGNGWVYCGDGKNLSAEKINLAAGDVCKHQVTFRGEDRADIQHRKYGNVHWWRYGENMDRYVIAYCAPASPCTEHKRQPKVTPDSANAMSWWKDNLMNRFTKVV